MTFHFKGKSIPEHLKEARQKGALVLAEIHGLEMPGHLAAFTDALKETVLLLLVLWIILDALVPQIPFWKMATLFVFGLSIWKTGRSALLGWARIGRLHRVIEEERWEIEHHRHQERQELEEMYRLKGLEGKLLTEVVDVLMADDNRLLRIMLEEELGLTLEAFEHPLKQACGALSGVGLGAFLSLLSLWAFPKGGIFVGTAIGVSLATLLSSRRERNPLLPTLTWNLAIATLTVGAVYFLFALLS